MSKKSLIIYVDGSCLTPEGPGGWAAFLRYGRHTKLIHGQEEVTTSNRMELTAAIEGLRVVSKADKPTYIYTDSQYVYKGITQWFSNWVKSGRLASGDIKNPDLWKLLDSETKRFSQLTFQWIPGHQNIADHNLVDRIARREAYRVSSY